MANAGVEDVALQQMGNQGYERSPSEGMDEVSIDVAGPSGLRRRATVSGENDVDQEAKRQLIAKLPSRQLGSTVQTAMKAQEWRKKTKKKPLIGTMRLRQGVNLDDIDGIADTIADEPEAARDLTTTLSNKKKIRAKATRKEGKKPGWFKRVGYSASIGWKHLKDRGSDVMYDLELWKGHIKTIEGNFGTGVTSYFLFMKWLLFLNIPCFILVFSLLTLPQILYTYIQKEPSGHVDGIAFTGVELLTGGGWFNQTELYYGAYINSTVTLVMGTHYDMRWAYLLVMAAYYLLIVLVVGRSVAKSHRQNFVEASDAVSFQYVAKAFTGWDYTVTNVNSAQLQHKRIFKELQEYLAGFQHNEEDKTGLQWCGLISLRIFTNIIILGLLGGSGYLVWYISVTQSLKSDIQVLGEMALALTISAMNFILPFAFSILATFERYVNPKVELYITMCRTILLNFVTLGVLLYFWYTGINCDPENPTTIQQLDNQLDCKECWETFMGEQIYRLVIVDFVFILLVTFFSEFIRRLMATCCCKSLGRPEFNIARNTLYLIYSQVLVWLGSFFCPLLPLIMIIKIIFIFYVKRISVMQNCVPSTKAWRAGQTNTIILGLVFIAFVLALSGNLWAIFSIPPSKVCGPYMGDANYYSVIVDGFQGLQVQFPWLVTIVEFITSTGFLAGILVLLCVIVYYMRIIAVGHEGMALLLKNQITLEGKDKGFLLKLLHEASKKSGTEPRASAPPTTRKLRSDSTGSSLPLSPGGKRFTKAAVEAMEGSNHSSQASRLPVTPRPRLADPRPSDNGDTDHTNPGYKDQSMDRRDSQGALTVQISPEGSEVGLRVSNPGYSAHSPTSKPNLPYPGQHYDSLHPQGQDNR